MKVKLTGSQAGEIRDGLNLWTDDQMKSEGEYIIDQLCDKLKPGMVDLNQKEFEIVKQEAVNRRDLWYERKRVEGRRSAGLYRTMAQLVDKLGE